MNCIHFYFSLFPAIVSCHMARALLLTALLSSGYQPPLYPWDIIHTDIVTGFTIVNRYVAASSQTSYTITEGQKHQADKRRRETPVYKPGERAW